MVLENHTQNEDCPQKYYNGIKSVKAENGSKLNHSLKTEKDGGD